MSTTAIPPRRLRGYGSETILGDGSTNINPDMLEPFPSPTDVNSPSNRYRARAPKLVTPERNFLNNGAYFEQTSVPKCKYKGKFYL